MKLEVPRPVRRGGLLRVAAAAATAGAEVHALAFVDLEFPDGHIERWLAGGPLYELSDPPESIDVLLGWGREASEDHANTVMCELAQDHEISGPWDLDAMPTSEVVIEWNHQRRRT